MMRSLDAVKTLHIGLAGAGPMLQAILDLFLSKDRGLFTGLDVAAASQLGDDAAALRRLAEHSIPVHPDWRAMLAARPDIDAVMELAGDEAVLAELRHELPPGTMLLDQRTAEFLWEVLTSDRLCLGCKLDLRRARTLLQTITDQLAEDILLFDTRGRIVDVNRNVLDRFGLRKQDVVGRTCREALGAMDGEDYCGRPGEASPFEETLRTGRNAEGLHTRVDPHGRMLYYRVYTYPVLKDPGDGSGELESILEIRRDITRRTYLERRLQQSEKLAAVGELSTFIAHEIRNPLFAIGGFANSLLRAGTLDDSSREKVRIILEESRRLDNILKSILNFARPTHARPGEVDVNQVVIETMDLMCIGCEKQGITVRLEYGADLAHARCDSELLKQCLINLVKNAMEAMENGGEIAVRTGMNDKYVLLEVRDTGKGIPPEIMDQVFNPFFSTKDKGSGLGLAMIRKIIDDIGGDMDLKSRVGEGTSVTLFLPPLLASEPSSPPETDQKETPREDGGTGDQE